MEGTTYITIKPLFLAWLVDVNQEKILKNEPVDTLFSNLYIKVSGPSPSPFARLTRTYISVSTFSDNVGMVNINAG